MTADLAAFERVLSRTALAMRVQAGLDWGSVALSASALGAGLWQVTARQPPQLAWLASLVLAGTLTSALCGLLWPVPLERVARALDRNAGLEGRVLAALSFRREPAARCTAFMAAALRDAARHASAVSVRRIVPLRAPRAWWPALLALLALIVSPLVRPQPEPNKARVKRALPALNEPLLDRDELEGLRREVAAKVDDATLSPALREQLAAYSALLTRLGEPGLSDDEAVARVLALEAKLPTELRSDSDDALLRMLAAELSRAQPELARALTRELAQAARVLRRLGAELRTDKLKPEQRAELAEALERARARERERLASATREAQLERLLHPPVEAPPSERSVLSRERERDARRELETLERTRPAAPHGRELQRLSRELAEAFDALAQQRPSEAAAALEQAADSLEQLDQRQRERPQERELARAVAQLRELLQRRAQAKSAPPEPRASEPERAARPAAASAETRRRAFEERAEGDDGEAREVAPDSEAQGPGDERTSSTTTTVLLPQWVQQRVETTERVSSGGGSEHTEGRSAKAPRADVAYQDHVLRGLQGSGPTRSQVIRGAAGAGFASVGYKKVYGDYRAHAETVLERDQVPPGARFQVRRYFELVRPREEQDAHE